MEGRAGSPREQPRRLLRIGRAQQLSAPHQVRVRYGRVPGIELDVAEQMRQRRLGYGLGERPFGEGAGQVGLPGVQGDNGCGHRPFASGFGGLTELSRSLQYRRRGCFPAPAPGGVSAVFEGSGQVLVRCGGGCRTVPHGPVGLGAGRQLHGDGLVHGVPSLERGAPVGGGTQNGVVEPDAGSGRPDQALPFGGCEPFAGPSQPGGGAQDRPDAARLFGGHDQQQVPAVVGQGVDPSHERPAEPFPHRSRSGQRDVGEQPVPVVDRGEFGQSERVAAGHREH